MTRNEKFTKTEREILGHRLDVPDAIAEALEEQHPDRAATEREAINLAKAFSKGEPFDADKAGQLQRDILRDCVDGSTFFAGSEDAVATGEITRGKLLAQQKAARSIEAKLEHITGRQVYFPTY